MKAMEIDSPISIRLHPRKGRFVNQMEVLEKVPWCTLGRYLPARPSFTFDPLFHAGVYYVQEAGSMLVEAFLKDAIAEMTDPMILDLCAAPGGKTTHLLSLLDGKGSLIANEVNSSRNTVLRHNISKWGYANVVLIQNEAARIAASGLQFDVILADVPCSGEGLFRKDPGARREWHPGSPSSCAIRQLKIIESILPALKPGGLLVYSTCTYAPEENDRQVEQLISRFGLDPVLPVRPDGIQKTDFGWQAFPHIVKSEGFWCTLLRKPENRNELNGSNTNRFLSKIQRKKSISMDYLEFPDEHLVIELNQRDWIIPERMLSTVSTLQSQVRIVKAGLQAGESKGKVFLPDIDIAWSVHCSQKTASVDLDEIQAIKYLQGETISPKQSMECESALVTFGGAALGWIKHSGKHWSNHYPKEYRIRSRR